MAKPKKLSCGVLVIDDKGCLLMQHVTGPAGTDHWDIPKGGQKNWEPPSETAIRELAEETGVIAEAKDLVDIGIFDYNPFKDVYLFVLRVKNIDIRKLTVNEAKEGRDYGHVDEYRMIPWEGSSDYMCQSLEYLYLDRMKKEVDIVVRRFNEQENSVEISYIRDIKGTA